MKDGNTYQASSVAVLVTGDPGTGKSRLAFAFDGPGILDCDGNLASAIRADPAKKFKFSQPYKDDAGKEVAEGDRWTKAVAESKALLIDPQVKTFVVDGLSNLCRWGLIYAENELAKAGINVRKEYLAKYAAFIPLLSNYLTMIRVPGKMVVVTVHQTMDKGELDGRVYYKLDIPGRLADTLGGQFTDVWGTSAQSDPTSPVGARYFIKTRPTGFHYSLKTSIDVSPSLDITNKSPSDIWRELAPKLSVNTPKT